MKLKLDKSREPPELEPLYDQADQEIQNVIVDFPEDLRKLAEEIPCYLNDYCEGLNSDGSKWEIYGRQTACYPGMVSSGGAIVIYVGTIFKHCQEHGDDFLHFIRCVYMHELGHHLGLSTEFELRERGL